jgi:septum formation protein
VFDVIPSQVEECITKSDPVEVAKELSRQKAVDVGKRIDKTVGDNGVVVIGADTIVVLDDVIMGKPKDHDHAIEMLMQLEGRDHLVITGVTLYYIDGTSCDVVTFASQTKVYFYPMSMEEITTYVETGEPMDKAGAYGIQGLSAAFIERIEGNYANVVGLPIADVYQELKERGWL